MAYLRDTAVILKTEPFREHDLWVTLYGRSHGKMEAVARGARRMSAKSLGHLEPCSEAEVMIAKGSAFDKLAVVRLIDPRLPFRTRLGALALAGSFVDFVDRLTSPGVADERIFSLLLEVLDLAGSMAIEPSSDRGRLLFAGASFRFLELLGYAPSFDICALCHAPKGLLPWLVRETSGLVCADCHASYRGVVVQGPLSLDALAVLRFLRGVPLSEVLRLTVSRSLMNTVQPVLDAVLHHVPLRSEPHGLKTVALFL